MPPGRYLCFNGIGRRTGSWKLVLEQSAVIFWRAPRIFFRGFCLFYTSLCERKVHLPACWCGMVNLAGQHTHQSSVFFFWSVSWVEAEITCLQSTGTISEFRTPKSYPENPCWAWGTHPCLQVKKNNQIFMLISRPQKCSRHPATRINMATLACAVLDLLSRTANNKMWITCTLIGNRFLKNGPTPFLWSPFIRYLCCVLVDKT